jgi:hypothetical protein
MVSVSDTLGGFIDMVNGVAVSNLKDPQHPARIDQVGKVIVEGWAISADAQYSMDRVFAVYRGGHTLAEAVVRADVSDQFKRGSLLMCGYRIVLPPGALGRGVQAVQILGVRSGKYYKFPAVLYVDMN